MIVVHIGVLQGHMVPGDALVLYEPENYPTIRHRIRAAIDNGEDLDIYVKHPVCWSWFWDLEDYASIRIVDDDPVCLQHLGLILAAEGYEVETAPTGERAIDLGRQSCPDVLLVDWKLKDRLDGLDVANALRAINPRLVTIIMTGYSAAHLAAEAHDAENVRVLEKPFAGDCLCEMVRQAAGAVRR